MLIWNTFFVSVPPSSRSNFIPIGRGKGEWPIRILACYLTYRLNPNWHYGSKVVASGIWFRKMALVVASFKQTSSAVSCTLWPLLYTLHKYLKIIQIVDGQYFGNFSKTITAIPFFNTISIIKKFSFSFLLHSIRFPIFCAFLPVRHLQASFFPCQMIRC
jgi:hypothetical protein